MRWRIYYSDGSTFSDRDGPPFEAPQLDVQVVAMHLDGRGFINHGKDAYYWRPDIGWSGCDQAGLWDYLMFYRGPKAVIFGRSVRDAVYWQTVERAGLEGTG